MKLDKQYEEQVYAGVLGKIIGVYLGRPFEGWTYERIMEELGPINYYVNDKLKQPICVTKGRKLLPITYYNKFIIILEIFYNS